MLDHGDRIGIVAFAPNDWRGQWVNRQHLLTRLGRRWPVVYSTGAWTVWQRRDPEWPRAPAFTGRFSREDHVWIDEPARWWLRWPRITIWDTCVVRQQASRLVLQLLALGATQSIAYVFHPTFLPYVARLSATRVVYHAYDLFDHQPAWSEELERAERDLLSRADLVIASSDAIADALLAKVDQPIRVLTNGANIDAYFVLAGELRRTEPPDLSTIPRPRIGYTGSLHPQLDYALIRAVAEARRHYHWVLIGPLQREHELLTNVDYQACRGLPNVHFLGARRHDQIPAYSVSMDVNVMVYRAAAESWTSAGHPLKVYEYLASGRPIVSAELPVLKALSHVIRFASGIDEWLEALDSAIAGGGRGTAKQRQLAAIGHSWDARARQLEEWLVALVNGPSHCRESIGGP